MDMIIRDVLIEGKRCLEKCDISNPNLDAEVLMCYLLGIDRSRLFVVIDERISKKDYIKYKKLIDLRSKFVPISYITGKKEFYGLNFFVEPGVLIPRPETEFVVDKCLDFIKKRKSPKVADICCGSGVISVTVAVFNRSTKVFASDISDLAGKLTCKNSKYHNVEERVVFLKGNLFEPYEEANLNNFDIIVSNPPYIATKDLEKLPRDVKEEPKIALDGGIDGLDFYRKIIYDAPKYLKPFGCLVLEIGWNQALQVKDMLKKAGFGDVEVTKDYAGFDRVVSGVLYKS